MGVTHLLKDANDVEDSVSGCDVREEGVAQALARGGPFDQPGDVMNLEPRGHLALGLELLNQKFELRVGHLDARLGRLDGAELWCGGPRQSE